MKKLLLILMVLLIPTVSFTNNGTVVPMVTGIAVIFGVAFYIWMLFIAWPDSAYLGAIILLIWLIT